MIITDGIHLISTNSQEELHRFAEGIGLKREWFQDHPKHPHYDILSRKIKAKALRSGAKLVDKRVLVRLLKAGSRDAELVSGGENNGVTT